jgi:hypothetical protein
VRDNPINYTDPSGHYPTYGEYIHNWSFVKTTDRLTISIGSNAFYGCNTILSKPPCYEWRWVEKEVDAFTFPFGLTKEKIIVPQLVPCGSAQTPPTALFEKKLSDDDETCVQYKQLYDDVIDEQAHSIRILGQLYDNMFSAYTDEQYYVYLSQYWAELLTLSTLETLAAQIRASARASGCDTAKWTSPYVKRIPPAPPLPPSKRRPQNDKWALWESP